MQVSLNLYCFHFGENTFSMSVYSWPGAAGNSKKGQSPQTLKYFRKEIWQNGAIAVYFVSLEFFQHEKLLFNSGVVL